MKKLILTFLLFPMIVFAQELEATVNINYEQLETAAKERLEAFKQSVTNYLNVTKFTGDNWNEDKIKCSFDIFFTSSAGETKYSAQLVVTSQRPVYSSERNSLMLSVLDNSWDFNYEQNQPLYFEPLVFRPLVSMLDFYAYIIIGFDMDSYGPDPLGGSEYFQQAFQIGVRGSNSNSNQGWQLKSTSYNRLGFAQDLTDATFQKFREDFMDYHYNGIDIYAKYKKEAQKNIVKLIEDLYQRKDKISPRSVLMKVFFDAKAGEIVEYLKDYPDKTIFTKLKKINPGNLAKYDAALGLTN